MSNPEYDTVLDYLTVGNSIVQARKVEGCNLSLTGLTVDINPEFWVYLDGLEAGYDRVLVTTTSGETVNMYVEPTY